MHRSPYMPKKENKYKKGKIKDKAYKRIHVTKLEILRIEKISDFGLDSAQPYKTDL
jgi:hypothetical protein